MSASVQRQTGACCSKTWFEADGNRVSPESRRVLHASGKGYFQDDTALVGPERAVHFTGWSACVVAGLQPQVERLIVESAADEKDFLRIVMAFRSEFCGVGARMETGQPGVFAGTGYPLDASYYYMWRLRTGSLPMEGTRCRDHLRQVDTPFRRFPDRRSASALRRHPASRRWAATPRSVRTTADSNRSRSFWPCNSSYRQVGFQGHFRSDCCRSLYLTGVSQINPRRLCRTAPPSPTTTERLPSSSLDLGCP